MKLLIIESKAPILDTAFIGRLHQTQFYGVAYPPVFPLSYGTFCYFHFRGQSRLGWEIKRL